MRLPDQALEPKTKEASLGGGLRGSTSPRRKERGLKRGVWFVECPHRIAVLPSLSLIWRKSGEMPIVCVNPRRSGG